MQHANTPVWDLPLRLWHWVLVLLVITAIVTGKLGGNAAEWHMRSGYAILTLMLFRIGWGFIGTKHARFASFVRGPRAISDYLRAKTPAPAGHNPVGALSVLALIAILLTQAILGLFANDDVMIEGPLYTLVSKATSDRLTGWHQANVYVLLGLVGLHVTAVLYYLLARGENLIRPMFTGHKEREPDTAYETPALTSPAVLWRAACLLGICSGGVWLLVTWT